MPRVVPSQVCDLIKSLYPQVTDTNGVVHIIAGMGAPLKAIATLANEIPNELITLSGNTYSQYVLALSSIEHQVQLWIGRSPDVLLDVERRNPVKAIYDLLRTCPDEASASTAVDLAFVSDKALRESIRLDVSAANRDLINGEWKGATVLSGSATEALLLWAIKSAEAKKTGTIQAAITTLLGQKILRQPPHTDVERWYFIELIEVSHKLDLIESRTAEQARLGKDFRNLIHPGRATRLGEVCDRGTALSALAATELVIRDLS